MMRACIGCAVLLVFQIGCRQELADPSAGTQDIQPSSRPAAPARALPEGFVAVEGAQIDASGWPKEIRCLKDESVMVFVPGGEVTLGLSDKQVAALANMILPWDLGAQERARLVQDAAGKIKPGKILSAEDVKGADKLYGEALEVRILLNGWQEQGVERPVKDLEQWRKGGRSLDALLAIPAVKDQLKREEIAALKGVGKMPISKPKWPFYFDFGANPKPGPLIPAEDLVDLEKRDIQYRAVIAALDMLQVMKTPVPADDLKRWREGGRKLDALLDIPAVWDALVLADIRAMKDTLAPPGDEIRRQLREDFPRSHTVKLGAFYIDKYEVTNKQYRKFFDQGKDSQRRPGLWYGSSYNIGGSKNPKFYSLWDDTARNADDQPVTCVGKKDSLDYAKWAGKQVPTRDQWQHTASGDDGRLFPWGSDFKVGYCACDIKEPVPAPSPEAAPGPTSRPTVRETVKFALDVRREWKKTTQGVAPAKVGQFPHDISPYGCYDMAGNVSEWVISPDYDQRPDPMLIPAGGNMESFRPDYVCPTMNQATDAGKLLGFRTILRVQ